MFRFYPSSKPQNYTRTKDGYQSSIVSAKSAKRALTLSLTYRNFYRKMFQKKEKGAKLLRS
ncbi:MAG TPA: hypothetical protein DCZ41_03755 [Firmicutes bacterium]|nr:hypothetical protein [Bacillota bacterium]